MKEVLALVLKYDLAPEDLQYLAARVAYERRAAFRSVDVAKGEK